MTLQKRRNALIAEYEANIAAVDKFHAERDSYANISQYCDDNGLCVSTLAVMRKRYNVYFRVIEFLKSDQCVFDWREKYVTEPVLDKIGDYFGFDGWVKSAFNQAFCQDLVRKRRSHQIAISIKRSAKSKIPDYSDQDCEIAKRAQLSGARKLPPVPAFGSSYGSSLSHGAGIAL